MRKYFLWEEKILKKIYKNPVPGLIVLAGLTVFVYGTVNYYKVRVLSFTSTPKIAAVSTKNHDIPTEIIIPSINVDLKVITGSIVNGVWQISPDSATYLDISSPPESGGNTVIYGHNLRSIFGRLAFINPDQHITVKTSSGKIFNYSVTQKLIVNPTRVDLVSPTTDSELTLYTCYGFADSQRLVIKATPQVN